MKTPAFAALAAVILVAPAAHAQNAPAPISIAVPHTDLDLARPGDVARLDDRIAAAAHNGCRAPEPSALGAREAAHACRVKARASATTARNAAVARAGTSALAYAGR